MKYVRKVDLYEVFLFIYMKIFICIIFKNQIKMNFRLVSSELVQRYVRALRLSLGHTRLCSYKYNKIK